VPKINLHPYFEWTMSVKKLVKKVKNAIKNAFTKKGKKIKPTTAKIQHRPMKALHDDDYVSEDELDKISGDSISLYTCEMPEERLAKIKALMMKTPTHNFSSPPNSAKHSLPFTEPLLLSGPRKDDLVEINQIRDKCVFLVPEDEDYMNMEEPNYDDFMDFSELQVTSTLLSAALEAEAPPPYSEIDPNSSK